MVSKRPDLAIIAGYFLPVFFKGIHQQHIKPLFFLLFISGTGLEREKRRKICNAMNKP